jgi:hypothetical protein
VVFYEVDAFYSFDEALFLTKLIQNDGSLKNAVKKASAMVKFFNSTIVQWQ